jgi:hypothetical protein
VAVFPFSVIVLYWLRPQDAVVVPQDRVGLMKTEKTRLTNELKEKKKEIKQEQKKVRKRKSTASKLSEEDVCASACSPSALVPVWCSITVACRTERAGVTVVSPLCLVLNHHCLSNRTRWVDHEIRSVCLMFGAQSLLLVEQNALGSG